MSSPAGKTPEAEPLYHGYPDWAAVTQAVWQRLPTTEEDRLLRAIFRQWRKDRSRRWPLVLTALCWPRLLGLHRSYRACDPDPAERWQFLLWAFYRIAAAAKRRPTPRAAGPEGHER